MGKRKYFGIAVVQMEIVPGDTEANVSRMLEIGQGCAAAFPWVNMICYSELAIPGFSADTWEQQAESIPGPSTDRFAAFAKEAGIYVQPGSLFEAADGKIYNSAPVLGPDGSLVAKHRKSFPWQPLEQSEPCPGPEFTVFDIPDVGRFGLCICYDFWFPEICRQLAWMGAEVILHPTMTPTCYGPVEKAMAQSRAIENQVYMVSCGGTGIHGGLGLAGGSMIIDPDGHVVTQLGEGENCVTEILHMDRVALAQEYGLRGGTPMLKHLGHYNPDVPMYKDIRAGEFYKKRTIPIDLDTYMNRRQFTLDK